jgi:hypothetical protein
MKLFVLIFYLISYLDMKVSFRIVGFSFLNIKRSQLSRIWRQTGTQMHREIISSVTVDLYLPTT